ncbi:VTT domain-containing protein [Cytobacillus sp.]|uniref:TVP38/TMEM64 family protein n=1 Tax=Cytobacillus sp. TaxID=2675269 RepID=UPI0028BE2BA2|nr:VTT domain-containing protein [Cytobacillus sp.]
MMKKWWVVIAYIIILVIGLIYKDSIFTWIQRSEPSDLPAMFFLSLVFAAIPPIPFTLFAGVMGAKYGVLIGLLINWFGGVSAAIIYFLFSRYYFWNFFINYSKRFLGVQRFQMMLEKNSFIAILFVRMVPIIPPFIVNSYSGVINISFRTFTTATAIGQVPPMFIISYCGNQMFSSLLHLLLAIFIYLLFLLFILLIYKIWFLQNSKFN